MVEANGYSIWLEPGDNFADSLKEVVCDLAKRYDTQPFTPHVTLIGGAEEGEHRAIGLTKGLAQIIKPYFIELTGQLVCGNNWTKSLFVEVAESEEVLRANQYAREVFGLETETLYTPHLSLMYSDTLSLPERLVIARSLNLTNLRGRFLVDKLHLYHTEGRIDQWHKLAEFPL